jgi:hypothetical protein
MDQCRADAYAGAVREHADPADAAEILNDTDRDGMACGSAGNLCAEDDPGGSPQVLPTSSNR